jgi:hypothetical protein
MGRRWLAVASALMLAWTFFLGAALTPGRALFASASRHSCLCLMCKAGNQKSCCCKSGTGHTLGSSCDLADIADSLLVAAPVAALPAVVIAPVPPLSTPHGAPMAAPAHRPRTRAPLPPHAPPRFLS